MNLPKKVTIVITAIVFILKIMLKNKMQDLEEINDIRRGICI